MREQNISPITFPAVTCNINKGNALFYLIVFLWWIAAFYLLSPYIKTRSHTKIIFKSILVSIPKETHNLTER